MISKTDTKSLSRMQCIVFRYDVFQCVNVSQLAIQVFSNGLLQNLNNFIVSYWIFSRFSDS